MRRVVPPCLHLPLLQLPQQQRPLPSVLQPRAPLAHPLPCSKVVRLPLARSGQRVTRMAQAPSLAVRVVQCLAATTTVTSPDGTHGCQVVHVGRCQEC